jgi:hypothetical protein
MENFGTSTNTTSCVWGGVRLAPAAAEFVAIGLATVGEGVGVILSEKIYRMAKKVNLSGRPLP